MAFDFVRFFDSAGIQWHRATRGNVTIQCPWCVDDPSHHLSVSLEDRGYLCWRNEQHRGRAPHGLIVKLLSCSFERASQIVEQHSPQVILLDTDFATKAKRMLGLGVVAVTDEDKRTLAYPQEFGQLSDGLAQKIFVPYLRKRGYTTLAVEWLCQRYDLRCCFQGEFAYRIIIPVCVNQQLVTWTARTISGEEQLRYKTLSKDVALASIKDTLFDHDQIVRGGDTLVICEGPFDAMRVNFFGEQIGIRATCLFGKTVSQSQRAQIDALTNSYDSIVCLFDRDVGLSHFAKFRDEVKLLHLPASVSDPAELDYNGFRQVFSIR